jgi:peptidoglycan biosynthesis protein MviN/MurJ (putative lipid II flippase)
VIKTESYKKGIVLSTGFNFIAKLVTFANSILVAYYFGTQIKTDIYFYAVATITMLISFVTALDHSVLIPEAMRIREQESEKKSMQFLNFFLYIYLFIGFTVAVIICINPVTVFTTVSQFDAAALQSNMLLLYLIIPLCILMLITNYLVNVLVSYKYFTMPMTAGLINSLFSIVFIVFFHDRLDIMSIIMGLVLGYLLNITLLLLLLKRKLSWDFRFVKATLTKKAVRNMIYAQLGNFATLASSYVPLYLFSGFNAGLITALNYGRTTSEIPNQLITSQFSSVSGIKFNELYARKEYEEFNKKFVSSTNFLLFILMPISGIFFLYAEEIISILYGRGAFNLNSVHTTSSFFRYLSLLIPCMAINTMSARIFMATRKIGESFWYNIAFHLVLIPLNFTLIPLYGIYGYIIAILVMYAIINIFCTYFLCKYLFKISFIPVLLTFWKLALINTIIVCIVWYFNHYLGNIIVIRIGIGCCVYVFLIIFLNYLLNLNYDFTVYCKHGINLIIRNFHYESRNNKQK